MKKLASVMMAVLMMLTLLLGTMSLAVGKSPQKETVGEIPAFVDIAFRASGSDTKEYRKAYKYCLAVNSKQNVVIVYGKAKDGSYTKPLKAMICSCGKIPGTTLAGAWHTYAKYEWLPLVGDVYGQYGTRIIGGILFHSVPYFEQDKSTLETEEYNKLGSRASAGCVRLAVKDAKWIYDKCKLGTIVCIYPGADVKEPLKRPKAVTIPLNSPYAGWDPTDPDPKNPWK